ncbi:MAG: DUF72 domain-containing protein [Gaiellaceae bacterium]
MGAIRIGCSGWVYDHWRGRVYPEGLPQRRWLDRFYASIEPLVGSPKLGPVLWQLLENFHRDDERLAAALARLPPGRHCFEFRHESWFAPDVYAFLREHGAALVVGDTPERPFQAHELTADWTFVRFHHGRRGRRGNYSDRELAEWAERLASWSKRADAYAYFNNDWEGFAVRNAERLKALLGLAQQPPAAS